MSFRLYNKIIYNKKKINIGLTQIFGIGQKTANDICKQAGIPLHLRVKELNKNQINVIIQIIKSKNNLLENNLQLYIKNNINKYKNNKTYKGIRHKRNLPVRGQRTHSNAKTQSKKW